MSQTNRVTDAARSKLLCPKDGYPMSPERVGNAVDHCDHCGAIWLDAGELTALPAKANGAPKPWTVAASRAPDRLSPPRRTPCPRDVARLAESTDAKQPHIRTDKCPTCLGILLDAGELKDLSKFTIKERLRALL